MDINELIAIVKKKIGDQVSISNIYVEDKTFLQKNHKGNEKGKYHLKISINSEKLKKMNKIESNRLIHKILN